jgi:hypothetical protein
MEKCWKGLLELHRGWRSVGRDSLNYIGDGEVLEGTPLQKQEGAAEP